MSKGKSTKAEFVRNEKAQIVKLNEQEQEVLSLDSQVLSLEQECEPEQECARELELEREAEHVELELELEKAGAMSVGPNAARAEVLSKAASSKGRQVFGMALDEVWLGCADKTSLRLARYLKSLVEDFGVEIGLHNNVNMPITVNEVPSTWSAIAKLIMKDRDLEEDTQFDLARYCFEAEFSPQRKRIQTRAILCALIIEGAA